MDQALEKAYNKPAKGQGGIIRFTRCKEVVSQFNLIRYEKAKISSFLRSICHLTIQDEYTLHHELSDSITKRDSENVKEAVDYIRNKHNPFMTEINDQMRNLVTEERVLTETARFSLQRNALGTDICCAIESLRDSPLLLLLLRMRFIVHMARLVASV